MIIRIGDITIDLTLKDIENIHLSVYPPEGAVKMTAPSYVSEESLKLYAISKLSWIKKEQKSLRNNPEKANVYMSKEKVFIFGGNVTCLASQEPNAPLSNMTHLIWSFSAQKITP